MARGGAVGASAVGSPVDGQATKSGHAAALTELRAGLRVLHERRGQLGTLDLQAGTAALGTELADLGLRLVLERGTPRQVFAWLELSRAQAFRVRPGARPRIPTRPNPRRASPAQRADPYGGTERLPRAKERRRAPR